ncbi:phosphonate C-P lyase system protein PhnG [Mesorhizobium sp.]|uniref:phosphonate C-P lyase system protein PhnG n=1 Tax=Mesorhizobium sp. TaxID=1871066 RepID=UPI0025E49BEA|nr:phosphonate C-P lyase system protein PhnG [Mesorhizobium sp.]
MQNDVERRQRWMAVLARASCQELDQAYSDLPNAPAYVCLRPAESGLVLVRGRAGEAGASFNLGEVTMTRCALKLTDGTTGFAFILGRDQRQAELAALFDALLQRDDETASATLKVISEFEHAQSMRRDLKSRKAAATKVDFFAMTQAREPE